MSEEQPGTEGESNKQGASDAKARTIAELKEFEQRKAEASISLHEKLSEFLGTLSDEERAAFAPMLQVGGANTGQSPVVSVYLKPMQVHPGSGDEDVRVFLKPMQVHPGTGESDVEVFLKPMQVHPGDGTFEKDVAVFLKPMQVHGTEVTISLRDKKDSEKE